MKIPPIALAAAAGGSLLLLGSRRARGQGSSVDALIGPAKLKPQRVGGPPPDAEPAPEPDRMLDKGSKTVEAFDEWACRRAKDQPVPDVNEWVPPAVLAAGGPITQAIQLGTNIVRRAFEKIGAKKVCTVAGGQWVQLTTVARDGRPRFWVSIDVAHGNPADPQRWGGGWIFRDNRGDSGPVTLRQESGGDTGGPKRDYLFHGGKPTGHLWPHVNIGRWEASVAKSWDKPRVFVVRSADDTGGELELWAWLPPRAPDSHVTVLGKHVVDAPTTWRLEWTVLREE